MMKLKKTLYPLFCLAVGMFLLSGCVEEYDAEISADDSDLLVVEGTINAPQCRFYLTRTQSLHSSETPTVVWGAEVSVHGSDGSVYPAQGLGAYYVCRIDRLSPDVTYYLRIAHNGEVYESEPQRPLPTEKIADVRGVQNTPESSIDVLVTPEAPFNPQQTNYYSWTCDETWQVFPDYETGMYYDTVNRQPAYKNNQFPKCGWVDTPGPTIAVGSSSSYEGQHISRLKMYDIDRSNVKLYHRYSGLVHQRAITKAEYEYELARRQASTEMGGLFTPLPSALPTNLRCLTSHKHVIGYVGCSMNTTEYRFFLNADDFSIQRPSYSDNRVWLEDPTPEECIQMVIRGMFLCEWLDPEMNPDGKLRAAWAYLSQLDVRARYNGAYTVEPDFWSLDENVSY